MDTTIYRKEPWLTRVSVLSEMASYLIREIRQDGLINLLDVSDINVYRTSFKRVPIKEHELRAWRDRVNLKEMAVEVIWTLDDSAEVHWHDHAYALLTVLGPLEGVAEPEGGTVYFKEHAYPAASGLTLDVPPGTKHGFGSPEGTEPIVFLSVQSRKIGDDLHVVR